MKKYLKSMQRFLMYQMTRNKKWRHLVTTMAMVVVFITTYALILPAITLEKEKGKPEQGVYLDDMERGSTASLNQSSSDTEAGQGTDGQNALMTGKDSDGLALNLTNG